MEFWPTPTSMLCAMGPGNRVIDIRAPGEYDNWHGFRGLPRDGLTCLDCLGAVNPRMLPPTASVAARPILVHSPTDANAEQRCESVRSTRRGAGWKKLLKSLIADYLIERGYESEIDPTTGGERIDILTRSGNRRIAIRVELDKLKVDDFLAALRQLERQDKDTEVLWITFGCSWVDIAKAVGIRFTTEPPKRGSIDVGGVFPVVDAGIFKFGMQGLAPTAPVGLGHFLEAVMAGILQSHPIEGEHRGWAHTRAWDQHIRGLVRRSANLEKQLRNLKQELQEARSVFQEIQHTLKLDIAAAERRATRAEAETTAARELTAAAREQLEVETAHRRAATGWGAEVERLRDTNTVARLALRRLAAFAFPSPTTQSETPSHQTWPQHLQSAAPWAVAVAAMTVPLVLIAYLTRTTVSSPVSNPVVAVALLILALLPAAVASFTNGRWCLALDNRSHRRGHRRLHGFMRRCGHREHSLNVFNAWWLVAVLESAALITWLLTQGA